MVLFFYSIKDELVGFNNPQLLQSDDIAIRAISSALRGNDDIRFNAKDYALYKLGSFDSDTGILLPYQMPVKVIDIASIFPEVKNEI